MVDGHLIQAEKENVLIQSGACSVTLLPHLGGKIASIRIEDRELLQTPLVPLAARTRTMPFDASDASGWDECLPSVAACTVETASGRASVPDHGDLWRIAWERPSSNGDRSVTLKGKCFSLPLELERTVDLSKITGGWRLQLTYRLTNTGRHAVPWSWAAHPLFTVDAGDTIVLPQSVTTMRIEGSGGDRLGVADDIIDWPHASVSGNGRTDLRIVQSSQSGIGDKLFTGPLAPDANWCELHRLKAGIHIRMRFDPAATPYLGLWICYGGWPDGSGPKQNCVAPEPATAPVDSLAKSGPWSRALGPGQSFSWPMSVEFETM
jgi:galactose mutarotase-like enzyme